MYSVTDELDLENLKKGIEAQVRLHEAAGAHRSVPLAEGAPHLAAGRRPRGLHRAGQADSVPVRRPRLFSAHQMGTCRMGEDPRPRSPARSASCMTRKGVWIGDASAFPTSSGTNPMVSIMALAHRTAEAIADDSAPTSAAAGARANDQRSMRGARLTPDAAAQRTSTDPIVTTVSTSAANGSIRPATETHQVIDPTTEEVDRPRSREGTPEDVDRAVKAAREGFEAWRRAPVEQRVEACTAISATLAERGDEIAALIARRSGMPLALSRTIQAGLPAMDFGSMAQVVHEFHWEEQIGNSLIVREPVGVVAASRPGTIRCTRSARRSRRRWPPAARWS